MSEMIESLGAMLIGIAFFAGLIAFLIVIYIRGLMLISESVIGYPISAVLMLMLCLSILLPLTVFRRLLIKSALDFLRHLTFSALRRGL